MLPLWPLCSVLVLLFLDSSQKSQSVKFSLSLSLYPHKKVRYHSDCLLRFLSSFFQKHSLSLSLSLSVLGVSRWGQPMFLLSGFSFALLLHQRSRTQTSPIFIKHKKPKSTPTPTIFASHLTLARKQSSSIMAKTTPQDFSSSKRQHFHWTRKVGNQEDDEDDQLLPTPTIFNSQPQQHNTNTNKTSTTPQPSSSSSTSTKKIKKLSAVAVSRLRSVLTAFNKNRSQQLQQLGLGTRVVGTLFGYRRGHVHFAFQRDPTSRPAFLIELATPISGLVKEMTSGLVRIALECDKNKTETEENKKKKKKLLEESVWRTYCNGKKCGFGTRRECGDKEWQVLKSVEPISMGAGVLPSAAAGKDDTECNDGGEIMYMRAKFERIVGSRDSEAFYMMNPDSNGAPELSIYLLRV